jgi:uncharacterized membrane protein
MKKQLSIRTMTSIAVLSAVAFVLAFFEFPVPLSPSFARMDLSDFPALIGQKGQHRSELLSRLSKRSWMLFRTMHSHSTF